MAQNLWRPWPRPRGRTPTLARLMGVLAHLGLLAETVPGQFTCTPLGALLQTDAVDRKVQALFTPPHVLTLSGKVSDE
jgi:hypothetical protein